MKRITVIIAMVLILLSSMLTTSTAGSIRAPALPPSPPKNLTADGSGGYVILKWNSSVSSAEHPVEKYNIYRGDSSGNETLYDSVDAGITTYNDYNVDVGNTYYYYVTAVNDAGESVPSNEVNVTVESGGTKPLPPQNFRAEWNENTVYLNWSAPSYIGSSQIKFYNVYRNDIRIANTTVKSYVDKNVDYHKSYIYYVTAVNADGLESNPSNSQKVEWSKPNPPNNLQAEESGDYIILTWQAENLDESGHLPVKEYRIYVKNDDNWKLLGNTTDTTFKIPVSSLPQGYVTIKVTAVNDLGEGGGVEKTVYIPSQSILPYIILGIAVAALIIAIYILIRRKRKNEQENSGGNKRNKK